MNTPLTALNLKLFNFSYSITLIIFSLNRMSFGAASRYISTMPDISRREFFVVLPLIIASFILGIYPNIALETLHLPLSSLLIGINTPLELFSNIEQ